MPNLNQGPFTTAGGPSLVASAAGPGRDHAAPRCGRTWLGSARPPAGWGLGSIGPSPARGGPGPLLMVRAPRGVSKGDQDATSSEGAHGTGLVWIMMPAGR